MTAQTAHAETIDINDEIENASADAVMAAFVQIMALEHTTAAMLEYIARRDGVEAVEAIRDRAKQITEIVAGKADNLAMGQAAPKALDRIDALTSLPITLSEIE